MSTRPTSPPPILAAACLGLSVMLHAAVATAQLPEEHETGNHGLRLRVMERTPAQIAAFYEARGFPEQAIARLREACFLTVTLDNQRDDRLALERWRFLANGEPLERRDRAYWQTQWQALGLSRGSRATFGWTLMPESRELYPTEPVAGNITLAPTRQPFTLVARLRTAADDVLSLRLRDIECAGREG